MADNQLLVAVDLPSRQDLNKHAGVSGQAGPTPAMESCCLQPPDLASPASPYEVPHFLMPDAKHLSLCDHPAGLILDLAGAGCLWWVTSKPQSQPATNGLSLLSLCFPSSSHPTGVPNPHKRVGFENSAHFHTCLQLSNIRYLLDSKSS